MITDFTIDEETAKYKCIFAGFDINKAKRQFKNRKKDNNNDKKAIEFALDITKNDLNEGEGRLTSIVRGIKDFLSAPPAWVEEPTGVKDVRPESIFKDVESGLKGYHKGEAIGAATATAILGRKFIPKLVKTGVKTTIKHPIGTAVGIAAATHPEQTAKVIDTTIDTAQKAKELAEEVNKKYELFQKIKDFFKPLVNFTKNHPIAMSAIASTGYALLATRSIWFPYVRRAMYELSSGKVLACVRFTANDEEYDFEYTLKKNKWALLSNGKIAAEDDTISFMKTQFCKKFIERCQSILNPVLNENSDFILAASQLESSSQNNSIKELLKNKKNIESNMFKGKVIL